MWKPRALDPGMGRDLKERLAMARREGVEVGNGREDPWLQRR